MRWFVFRLMMAAVFVAAAAAATPCASAQVLARPGWAGSGLSAEPWWRRGVFYRVQPELFQDSTGTGKGDLRGIMQRLDYLNRLGVDAIVLVPPFEDADFGELTRATGSVRLRVIVQLSSGTVDEARHWLTQGAAGIFLDARMLNRVPSAETVSKLRKLTDSFPGERILLASGVSAAAGVDARARPELAVSADFGNAAPDAAQLRTQLASAVAETGRPTNPLLELSGLARAEGGAPASLQAGLALAVFGSRAAVLFDAGRELGLRSADGRAVAMQWTPSNVTRAAPAPVAAAVEKPPTEVYGTYRPYVPPAQFLLPKPKSAEVVESALAPPADLNTLPGFSTGALPARAASNGTTANAATEEYDAGSLLNLYRRLIALHHGNWTLRNGSERLFAHDAQNALVWVRRSPAGTRTTASLVAAVNLSEKPVQLSLADDLNSVEMRGGVLRTLVASPAPPLQHTAEHLELAAGAVFAGELVRGGGDSVAVRRRHR